MALQKAESGVRIGLTPAAEAQVMAVVTELAQNADVLRKTSEHKPKSTQEMLAAPLERRNARRN